MELNIWIALLAGLASFISPCCLPLYPSYISYITGISVSTLKTEKTREVRLRTTLHTLFFILGFSIVYYSMGAAAGVLAEVFRDYKQLISQIAAILIIVMGLFLLGIFKPQLLMKDVKLKFKKQAGYFGSLLVGIGFAAGWSPCVGPILGSIVGLALDKPGSWFPLMTAYTLGFAIPFFIMAFFIGSTKWILRFSNPFMKIGGALMIVIGIFLYTGQMTKISIFLQGITPSWLG